MINTTTDGGRATYNLKDFVLDTASDLTNLPTNCAPGSTAFVISTKKIYMLNSNSEWKEI